jgi:serine phosphatase RsbU (regulator of sigma subunit)/putative methionine-R-sulfoxide reductase with GAF domain/anti-sigma regulatory factor (Ser/Thr protein kinase)
MRRSREEAADEVARVQVELAAAAAGATPLAELDPTIRDLSRVQPLLEQLAAAVARLLGTDTAAVWVTDPSEDVLVASAWVGFPADYIGPMRVPFGTGSAGRAVAERRTVLVQDVESSPHYASFREGALAHGVRAVLSVPMLTLGGEPMGALSTYYGSVVAEQNPRDLELVELYARQAAEIVERARLHGQARQLAALERQRALQLRTLAGSALTLTAAESLDELLRLVTDAALEVVGCHQAVTTRLPSGWADASTHVSLSEKYAAWRGYDVVPRGVGVLEVVTRENRPLRLTGEQLRDHPEWQDLATAPGHPPLPDYLAAPLVGRDGANLGLVQLSDKLDGTRFSAEDEAMLVQLAQLASATVERLEAFEGERAARREAQRAAEVQNVLSEASALFAEHFDPAGITTALAEIVVPRFATLAVVHVVDAEGQVTLAALQTADPQERAATTAVFAGLPISTDQRYGPGVVLATGRVQPLPELTTARLERYVPEPEQLKVLLRSAGRHGVCVPLTARGSVVGVLSLTRGEPYDAAEVEQALDLARRAALALDNANRYAFERDLAVTLQRSLLPRSLPTGPAFRSAARYLPGASGTQVGGDWYDVVEVGDSLVMVVGDVMGRGVKAAAVMGQLQATVRAYALEGHRPVEILRGLDRVALRIDDLDFTTCVVASLDLRAGTLTLASAGHLPPVIVAPDGGARLLELDPGLPLGVGGGEFVEESLPFAPGSLVLLYTDGLVERRDAPIEEGLEQLVRALGRPVASADDACERVLGALGRDGDADDDTAVLAVQLASPPDLELDLPGELSSAGVARHALRDLLQRRELDPDVGQLLVTELVANAVRHAGSSSIRVLARLSGGVLRVEVEDRSEHSPPGLRQPPWQQESGRGLLLVDVLAERWGVDALSTGKRVWFDLAPEPG